MEDIIRRIKKAGKITSTADWELNRLLMLGYSSEDLQKIIASAVDFDDDEVKRLYEEVIANDYTAYKKQYEDITGDFTPYEENEQLQQIVEAMTRQTEDELYNITKSTGFMVTDSQGKKVFTPLSDIYNDYLDQAMVDLTSGAYDYNTIIRRVCKELTDSGLRSVDYASGWSNRVDVAARRAVLTGLGQLSGRITDMNAERLGVDRFEVSWHVGARPDHAAWQGKVYTKKQLRDVCGLGTGSGLQGWNCRHEYYLFFEGSERLYTDEWLAEQNAREAQKKTFRGREYNTYEATQKQRQMETAMRAQREKVQLLEEADADPDDVTIEKCKYQAQLDEYKEFSKTMGMKEQKERIYYDLKGRVAPSKKQYKEYLQEKEDKHIAWLKSIGAEDTSLNTVAKYEEAKYNKTREYQLLRGYKKAVEKGDIHALVGFEAYKKTAQEVENAIVGTTTIDGTKIESYATHFLDRVIGQTSTSHKNMRLGVPVTDALEALTHGEVGNVVTMADGDIRRMYRNDKCSVIISVRDKKIIQTNPR